MHFHQESEQKLKWNLKFPSSALSSEFNVCSQSSRLTPAPFKKDYVYENKKLIGWCWQDIYECHKGCKCNNRCPNRVVSNGGRYLVQVINTTDKGFGVQTLQAVPKGAFIWVISKFSHPSKCSCQIDCFIKDDVTSFPMSSNLRVCTRLNWQLMGQVASRGNSSRRVTYVTNFNTTRVPWHALRVAPLTTRSHWSMGQQCSLAFGHLVVLFAIFSILPVQGRYVLLLCKFHRIRTRGRI